VNVTCVWQTQLVTNFDARAGRVPYWAWTLLALASGLTRCVRLLLPSIRLVAGGQVDATVYRLSSRLWRVLLTFPPDVAWPAGRRRDPAELHRAAGYAATGRP